MGGLEVGLGGVGRAGHVARENESSWRIKAERRHGWMTEGVRVREILRGMVGKRVVDSYARRRVKVTASRRESGSQCAGGRGSGRTSLLGLG